METIEPTDQKKRTGLFETLWQDLKDPLRFYILLSVTGLIDTAFLVGWIVLQWNVDQLIIEPYRLKSADGIFLDVFQYIFSISTLIPVLIFIYKDTRIMIIRAQREIQEEQNNERQK